MDICEEMISLTLQIASMFVEIYTHDVIFSFQIRSETITTYALCGFANFSSLGIVIGGLCEYFVIIIISLPGFFTLSAQK